MCSYKLDYGPLKKKTYRKCKNNKDVLREKIFGESTVYCKMFSLVNKVVIYNPSKAKNDIPKIKYLIKCKTTC